MIPNIVHFNYGLIEQTEEFLFVYYIAVLSCKVINKPDKIFFHYHYEPYGYWWNKTKPLVDMIKVDVPESIGHKPLLKVAHKSDILRMQILKKYGGVYLDIDTICVRPYKDLLFNKFVIAREITSSGKRMGLCNAIMMSEPNNDFMNEWYNLYERIFDPNGWGESSIHLPYVLSQKYNNLTILDQYSFLFPDWQNIKNIFVFPADIKPELITLHLWNQYSGNYLKSITGFGWIVENGCTLYGKLLINLLSKMETHSNNVCMNKIINFTTCDHYINNIQPYLYNETNNLKINHENILSHYKENINNNLIISPVYKNDIILCENTVSKVFDIDFDFCKDDNIVMYNSNKCDFNYNIQLMGDFYKVKITTTNNENYHLKIQQQFRHKIIYNLKDLNEIYLVNEDLLNFSDKIDEDIIIVPNICIKKCLFKIQATNIKDELYLLKIERTDTNSSWPENLYIDVIKNFKSKYFYVGKSSTNIIYCMIDMIDTSFSILPEQSDDITTKVLDLRIIE